MSVKLFDSELKVMDVLWGHDSLTAKQISDILAEEIGWNINTTYTVIKKCVSKGAVERSDPGFLCRAIIPREEIQKTETDELINKVFGGSVELLFASLLNQKNLSPDQLTKLRRLVEEMK